MSSEEAVQPFPPNPPQAILQCVGEQGQQLWGSTELRGAAGKEDSRIQQAQKQ